MISENLKNKLLNGSVCVIVLMILYALLFQVPEIQKRANDSINDDLWRGYSGFYNRGYENGFEDAKAGRERSQPVSWKLENGVVTDAGKTD